MMWPWLLRTYWPFWVSGDARRLDIANRTKMITKRMNDALIAECNHRGLPRSNSFQKNTFALIAGYSMATIGRKSKKMPPWSTNSHFPILSSVKPRKLPMKAAVLADKPNAPIIPSILRITDTGVGFYQSWRRGMLFSVCGLNRISAIFEEPRLTIWVHWGPLLPRQDDFRPPLLKRRDLRTAPLEPYPRFPPECGPYWGRPSG